MNSTLSNHNAVVRSTFTTSDHMNHGDLFSSPPSFSRFQNSHVSSSSFALNNSYHMRRDTNSVSGVDIVPMQDNPQFSQVSFTQTITNKYSAIVPTSEIANLQNNLQRPMDSQTNTWNRPPSFHPQNVATSTINHFQNVQRPMDAQANTWNRRPSFHPQNVPATSTSSFPNVVQRPIDSQTSSWVNPSFQSSNFAGSEILQPEPLNVVFPQQDSIYRQHLDLFSAASKQHPGQHVPQDAPPLQDATEPAEFAEEFADQYLNPEEEEISEDDPYDGRTHSLPYEKYGPYTCPKCSGVFDTSQKFAAHMSSHYKTETNEERYERYRARNKKRFRKLHRAMYGQSKRVKLEDGVSNGGASGSGNFQQLVVVKEEPL
ncbi:unnamed protein product [Thlaspi arvense]|uniref:C2H2-type domain-containing protein n=1 Tax=Thlaspi arvense TaxID=13288 RepID=A0AAU9RTX5_THLAR|nr:unnamed protein product [Thlaspi arvense]